MEEGEQGDSLFVVVEGRFLVDVGTDAVRQRIAEVGPGRSSARRVSSGAPSCDRRASRRSSRERVIRLGIGELDTLARSGAGAAASSSARCSTR
jgi:hypothetical protein